MPDPTDSRSPSFWSAFVRARLEDANVDPDVSAEIAQHAEELYRAARIAGRSDREALAAIDAEIADLPALLRTVREAQQRRDPPPPLGAIAPGRSGTIPSFWRDVMYGARLLTARPMFTAVAVVTLALGIGANTAIFSVVHSVLLAPLPFADPDRLVMMWETDGPDDDSAFIVAAPNWQDWTKQSTSFTATAIWEDLSFNIAGGADPEQVPGLRGLVVRLPDAWRRSAARTHLQAGRGRARPQRRRHQRRTVAAAVRCPSGYRRPGHPVERAAVRDHRRHAAVVRVHREELRGLGAHRVHGTGRRARVALLLRRRQAETGVSRSRRQSRSCVRLVCGWRQNTSRTKEKAQRSRG